MNKKIVYVQDFILKNDYLFLLEGNVKENQLTVVDFMNNETTLLHNEIIPSINICSDRLWAYTPNGTFEFELISGYYNLVIHDSFMPKCAINNLLIGEFQNTDGIFLEARDNANHTLWRAEYSTNHFSCQNAIFLIRFSENFLKNELVVLNSEKGDILWNFQLDKKYRWINSYEEEQEPEFVKIIGVFKEILWLGLNSGNIVGLNMTDGKESFFIDRPSIFPAHWDVEKIKQRYPFGYDAYIDAEKGVMFTFIGNRYNELDLKLPEPMYTIFDVEEELNESVIENNFFGNWNENEIFFGQKEWGTDISYVGIFNRESKKVTWTNKLISNEVEIKGLKKIILTQKSLYVLDGVQTLHVIDRRTTGISI